MGVPYLACMAMVASIYHLPPRALPSIQAVEGGRPGSVHVNANNSEDLGVMQVNTLWIGPLARYTGLDAAVLRDRLLHRDCFNIAASGAILRTYLNQRGGNLMLAIGDYHSHMPLLNQSYQVLVRNAAARLFAR